MQLTKNCLFYLFHRVTGLLMPADSTGPRKGESHVTLPVWAFLLMSVLVLVIIICVIVVCCCFKKKKPSNIVNLYPLKFKVL